MMRNSDNHALSNEYTDDDLRIADMMSEGGSAAPTAATPPRYKPELATMSDEGGPAYDLD